ncbi:hypothetical protein [Promicromonospora sukumoe]|uniref:Uncharacterized protein n=1 Tax=Promicromonospora sukumoe TaxID=88382 RepID=A0A7W3PDH0_9MICO|nr:hypothetical protein [Promicromonospora sukumoe]MBA8807778.1 hypothetical protein [Promicromonospora sukumoe]
MLVDGSQCGPGVDHLKLEQGGESGQRDHEVCLDVRVSVRGDVALRDRLPDEALDHCSTVTEPAARLLEQFRVAEEAGIGSTHAHADMVFTWSRTV